MIISKTASASAQEEPEALPSARVDNRLGLGPPSSWSRGAPPADAAKANIPACMKSFLLPEPAFLKAGGCLRHYMECRKHFLTLHRASKTLFFRAKRRRIRVPMTHSQKRRGQNTTPANRQPSRVMWTARCLWAPAPCSRSSATGTRASAATQRSCPNSPTASLRRVRDGVET